MKPKKRSMSPVLNSVLKQKSLKELSIGLNQSFANERTNLTLRYNSFINLLITLDLFITINHI